MKAEALEKAESAAKASAAEEKEAATIQRQDTTTLNKRRRTNIYAAHKEAKSKSPQVSKHKR